MAKSNGRNGHVAALGRAIERLDGLTDDRRRPLAQDLRRVADGLVDGAQKQLQDTALLIELPPEGLSPDGERVDLERRREELEHVLRLVSTTKESTVVETKGMIPFRPLGEAPPG